MTGELLDVLTPEGEPTGQVRPRNDIHRDGSWHRSVHIWLIDGAKVLLQKRAVTKECYPGLYDVSAAGHVMAEESCEEAAVRETYEELHIMISEESLLLAGIRRLCIAEPEKLFLSNEYNYVYVVPISADRCEIVLQEEEVAGIHWEEFRNLSHNLRTSKPGYCIDPEEADMVLKFIENILS